MGNGNLNARAKWLSAKAALLRERADSALIALVSRQRPLWWRFGIGILLVALAIFFRLVILQELGPRRTYITFYPAITLAALIGGLPAGALATVLSALTASLWIEPPASPAQWLAFATFLFSCALITGVTEAMRRAQARAVTLEEQAKLMGAVRDSEARLQLFVTYAPGALAMFDREMRYVAVSHRWLAESGLEGRDLRGLSHYDLYPDIPDRWREIHRRVLNGEVLGAEEEPFKRVDGRTQWVRWEVRPWHGADGQVAGIVIFSEDITERKQTEMALKDREEHLRAVFEAAVDAIFTIDEKGLIQSANPAATRLLGYEESELTGQNVSMLMPEPDQSAHNQYLQNYLTTGEAKIIGYGREVKAACKDGTWLTVELSVGEAAQGGRRLFVGVLHDITERQRAGKRQLELLEQLKQSEAEARKQQALFRSVFESAPEGIVLTDTQHRATMVNPALQRIFGYGADELIGALPSKFYARPEFWKPINEATSSRGNGDPTRTSQIVRCRRKNGEVFPGATIRVPYRDSRGNLFGYLRIFRDATQEQKREEERRQAQRLEALGELTGGIAHDFNNLLTVISGNLQLLEMKLGDERLARYLSEAERAVQMGERLSQRLVTFARQRRLTPTPANLNEQVNNMLELLRRTIGGQITVTTVLAGNLWRTLVDISEIENAILNLAINARDAMPNGGRLIIETGNLWLYDRGQRAGEDFPPGSYVRLAVSDTGSGMPPEVLARAFEPYFTTKAPGKGTGLGLATVYGFVKQSGGHVGLSSEVGRGTIVSIYLPRLEESGQAELASQKAAPPVNGKGETILVVEDDPDVLRVTAEMVKFLGYEVRTTSDAQSALAALEAGGPIDLVFSDVVMPGGMSGFDLARAIRKRNPSQKLLLTSGFAGSKASTGEKDDIHGLLKLRKPYSHIELGRAIRSALMK